jgi:hypothetical protein
MTELVDRLRLAARGPTMNRDLLLEAAKALRQAEQLTWRDDPPDTLGTWAYRRRPGARILLAQAYRVIRTYSDGIVLVDVSIVCVETGKPDSDVYFDLGQRVPGQWLQLSDHAHIESEKLPYPSPAKQVPWYDDPAVVERGA